MNIVMTSAAGALVLFGAAFFVIFRQLALRPAKALPEDWENLFAPLRYKPVERLLSEADYRLLESYSGGRALARQLRTSRVRIFRGYMRCLDRDFSRVTSALRTLMAQAPADRSALAGLILRQRIMCSTSLVSVHFRLTLYSFGWSAPAIDLQSLIGSLETMRAQLRSLALAAQPAAA